MDDERDIELRRAASERVRALQRRFEDLVPVDALRAGFEFRDRRVSYGSFYSGIFRPKEMSGPAGIEFKMPTPRIGRRQRVPVALSELSPGNGTGSTRDAAGRTR